MYRKINTMNNSKFILELIEKKEELNNKLNEDIKLLLERHNQKLEQLIQKAESKNTNTDAVQFVNEILQYREDHKDNDTDDWRLKDKVKASKLYEKYNEWRIENNKEEITNTKFGRDIKHLLPNKKRITRGNIYIF
mgnify:CR=1 FL=1